MWIRRTLVAGAVASMLVAGGGGAAGAMAAVGAHGGNQCAKIASGRSEGQRELQRLDRKIQRLSTGPHATDAQTRILRLEARKAKVEQRIQAHQAACNA